MEEAFDYANNFDTYTEYEYYNPAWGDDGSKYYPQEFIDISFEEDLLSLTGITGHVVSTESVEGRNYMIGGDLIIDAGNNLTLANGGSFYFGNEIAKLTAELGSELIIQDNVSFYGYFANKIIIDGNISIGNSTSFTGENNTKLDIDLNNYSIQATFNNSTFQNVNLDNFSQELTISNSVFNDYYRVLSHRGNVDISNTDFISGSVQAWILLENTEDNQNVAEISSCNFTTSASLVGIDMWNYKNYYIMDNSISGFGNGIQILQSGYGDTRKNVIGNNTINNCTHKGILSYGSRGGISNNQIINNGYGIWLGNQSDINVYGNKNAINYQQTQVIRDNNSYEVYASTYSFPTLFCYNAIIDDDNIGAPYDPLVYFSGGTTLKNVKYNCWEDISGSFDPVEDLYPNGYSWEPTWCPGGGINGDPDPAKDMYDTATNLFDAEDFLAAKDIYLLLIDQYPQSKYAQSALQELYALEKFVSNDYSSLKDYYANDNTIQTNQELTKTGDYLVSKCDVKLNNWSGAIEYYEDIILNPESMEDSIFAIVDLGYVYYNMENSENKSTYTGSLTQYKPSSQKQFFEDRDFLLSLIPKNAQLSETLKENLDGLTTGELLRNVPNPFKESTQIYYKLNAESNVKLSVYNYTGQLIKTYKEGTKTKGIHYIDFDANGLKNGIYLYSISINGQITDSKKMTIMK